MSEPRTRPNARRTFIEVLLSVGALGIVLAVLVASSEQVREQLNHPRAAAELVDAGAHAWAVTSVSLRAAKEQAGTHAPLTILVIAAGVLTLFMVRT
jgi:hypothetical protein